MAIRRHADRPKMANKSIRIEFVGQSRPTSELTEGDEMPGCRPISVHRAQRRPEHVLVMVDESTVEVGDRYGAKEKRVGAAEANWALI